MWFSYYKGVKKKKNEYTTFSDVNERILRKCLRFVGTSLPDSQSFECLPLWWFDGLTYLVSFTSVKNIIFYSILLT